MAVPKARRSGLACGAESDLTASGLPLHGFVLVLFLSINRHPLDRKLR
jgi:hypothetical protein